VLSLLSRKRFTISSAIIIFICLFVSLFPEKSSDVLSWIQNYYIEHFSWAYILLIFCLFFLCIYFTFTSHGTLTLGKGPPEYGLFTWFSMLFSAGMGTGLLFSGVYEPLYHYIYPPEGMLGTGFEAFKTSFLLTYLHWGISGWVCYTIIGLIFAHFCFNKELPFRFSSLFYPFIKEKIYKSPGQMLDILCIVSILVGVAVTLGRGAMQINSGLNFLFQIPWSPMSQVLIIIVLTLFVTISVLSGLNKGIKRLSQLNIVLCLGVLLFTLFMGPTVFILNIFTETFGFYLQNLIKVMTWTESLGTTQWRSQWTILYWAWWIAWAPFVGIFIARISKGRTIREFVAGTLIVPALLSCFWFAVFGGSGIHLHHSGNEVLASLLNSEYSLIVFKFFEQFPLGTFLCFITLLNIVIFFITSSDSASYIIYQMTKKGDKFKNLEKLHWSFLEGVVALLLIFTGGIKSLELLVVVITFPFLLLIPIMCFGFLKELKKSS